MPHNLKQFLPGRRIPDPGCIIKSASGDQLPIRTKGNVTHATLMTCKGKQLMSSRGIPYDCRGIKTARRKVLSIGTESHIQNLQILSGQSEPRLAGFDVPDRGWAIASVHCKL